MIRTTKNRQVTNTNCGANSLKVLLALILSTALVDIHAAERLNPLKNSRQIIVVTAESWTTSRGIAYWFDRQNDWNWQQRGGPAAVVIGRAGLAWGRGENDPAGLTGPIKREGDDKAPAGIFRLGTAFGYGRNSNTTRMPYLRLSTNIVAVDDSVSRYYNQLIDKTKVSDPDWRSAEDMVLADNRYEWGVVVQHNVPPVPRAGSCIFLHVWKDSVTPTSGCTAMPKGSLLRLLRWLDPSAKPMLVQVPRSIYNEQRLEWGLPGL